MRALFFSSLAGLRNWQLWLLQFFGNAVLFAAAAGWLLIPDEHWWQLAAAAISGIAIIFLFLWLQAGTLITFTPAEEDNQPCAFKRVLCHLFGFFVWALVFHVVLHLVNGWSDSYWRIANYVVSILPSGLRSSVPFNWPLKTIEFIFAALYWYVVPVLFLPFGLATARGISRERFREAFRTLRRLWYWVLLAVFVIIGVYVSSLLIDWRTPGSLTKESFSLGFRLFFAYVLAIGCWLMTASLLSAVSHPKAAVAPAEAASES